MIYDIAVVGGGPAGLATAVFAAQSGLSVVVVEKRQLPLDKACGEGLMPRGTRLLREMGVNLDVGEYIPFVGIRYVDDDVVAEGRFSTDPGWGIRRTKLVEGMHRRAKELGVTLLYGVSAKGWDVGVDRPVVVETDNDPLESRFLVGADGLHSKTRRATSLERSSRGLKRYGVRRHFEIEPWSSFVEVHWADGVEAYVTPVGSKEVGVALLWSGESARFEQLLERFPRLYQRLAGASSTSQTRGAGPFRQRVSTRFRGPVALVGDAAGYMDALTGEGLSLSFLSARALVRALTVKDLKTYDRDYRRLCRTYYWTTGLLLQVARRPRVRRDVIETLAKDPSLFDSLLAIATGEKPLRSFGFQGIFDLLGGLAKVRS